MLIIEFYTHDIEAYSYNRYIRDICVLHSQNILNIKTFKRYFKVKIAFFFKF